MMWGNLQYPKLVIELNRKIDKTPYGTGGLNLFLDTLFLANTGKFKELKEVTKKLNEKEKELLKKALYTFANEAEKYPFQDILGDFVLEKKSKIDKQYKGQFFTPQPICEVMARITIDSYGIKKILQKIKKGELFSMKEPSSGSGRMILATAKVLKETIPTPLINYLYTEAVDIDPLCVKMTVINTSIWGIPCKVIQGSALEQISQSSHEIYYNLPLLTQINLQRIKIANKKEIIKRRTEESKKRKTA